MFGLSKFGPIPKDAAGINKWESILSLRIVEQYFKTNEYSSVTACRELSMVSSHKGFIELSRRWTKVLGKVPPPLFELFLRAQLRMSLRKGGVTEIQRVGNDAVLTVDSLTSKKWTEISQNIPEDTLTRLTFSEETSHVCSGGNFTEIRGIVCFKRIFPDGSNGMVPNHTFIHNTTKFDSVE